jgi:transposase
MRKKHDTKFKARVALEAIKGEKTIVEIASEYKIHPNMVTLWKKKALSNMSEIFEKGDNKKEKDFEKEKDVLYKEIGKMKIENEWLKKKLNLLF